MSADSSQQFVQVLDKKLRTAADRLRANLDAAVYKHADFGLIFLKYISDSFAARLKEIEAPLRDSQSNYYLEKTVFWVPALARWKTLQDSAKLPLGTEIEITNGKRAPIRSAPPAGSSTTHSTPSSARTRS